MEQMREVIGAQRALFAGRGIDPTLGSPRTLQNEERRRSSRDIDRIELNSAFQQNRFSIAAKQKKREVRTNTISGIASAADTLGGGYMKYKRIQSQDNGG